MVTEPNEPNENPSNNISFRQDSKLLNSSCVINVNDDIKISDFNKLKDEKEELEEKLTCKNDAFMMLSNFFEEQKIKNAKEKETFEKHIEDIVKKLQILSTENEKLKNNNAKLQDDHKKLQMDHEKMKKEYAKIEKMNKQLLIKNQELVTKNMTVSNGFTANKEQIKSSRATFSSSDRVLTESSARDKAPEKERVIVLSNGNKAPNITGPQTTKGTQKKFWGIF